MQNIPKFKAVPIDQTIFGNPPPKTNNHKQHERRRPTIPQGFHFETDDRAKLKAPFEFQPLPSSNSGTFSSFKGMEGTNSSQS